MHMSEDADKNVMKKFACQNCGREFSLSTATLAKFPNWQPKQCMDCKNGRTASASHAREENLTTAEVLEKYHGGPKDGAFTDGAAEPNPGPGGWGAVYVVGDKVIGHDRGYEPHTTNNRMELIALRAACGLVPEGVAAVIYSDSKLCVETMNTWAKGWEARGWKKKGGEIKNLELVQEIYGILKRRPELRLEWIAAHVGHRWNEYADSLATEYRRDGSEKKDRS
jgi:ribonuclease HI